MQTVFNSNNFDLNLDLPGQNLKKKNISHKGFF